METLCLYQNDKSTEILRTPEKSGVFLYFIPYPKSLLLYPAPSYPQPALDCAFGVPVVPLKGKKFHSVLA